MNTTSKSSSDDLRLRAQQVVVARRRGATVTGQAAADGALVLQAQVARLAEPDLVPARLRLQHQGEGRVASDLDPGQRIHHEEELHTGSLGPGSAGSVRARDAVRRAPGILACGQQVLEAVLAHPVVERRAVDAQRARGVGDVALGALDRRTISLRSWSERRL